MESLLRDNLSSTFGNELRYMIELRYMLPKTTTNSTCPWAPLYLSIRHPLLFFVSRESGMPHPIQVENKIPRPFKVRAHFDFEVCTGLIMYILQVQKQGNQTSFPQTKQTKDTLQVFFSDSRELFAWSTWRHPPWP